MMSILESVSISIELNACNMQHLRFLADSPQLLSADIYCLLNRVEDIQEELRKIESLVTDAELE